MKVIGVIPARYQSSRLPGKPLVKILGKPLVIWVCEIVEKALGHENTIVATDDKRIAKIIKDFGYKYIMTSSTHLTGTDRVAEVSRLIDADIYLNIQGDEPLLNPNDIIKVIDVKKNNLNYIINAMTYLTENENPRSVNIPKVVVANDNSLIYMSRLPIPGNKKEELNYQYSKQVCIYAFTKEELDIYFKNPSKTPIEEQEDIEILRFLELGIKIKMVRIEEGSLAVDVPADIKIVEDELQLRKL